MAEIDNNEGNIKSTKNSVSSNSDANTTKTFYKNTTNNGVELDIENLTFEGDAKITIEPSNNNSDTETLTENDNNDLNRKESNSNLESDNNAETLNDESIIQDENVPSNNDVETLSEYDNNQSKNDNITSNGENQSEDNPNESKVNEEKGKNTEDSKVGESREKPAEDSKVGEGKENNSNESKEGKNKENNLDEPKKDNNQDKKPDEKNEKPASKENENSGAEAPKPNYNKKESDGTKNKKADAKNKEASRPKGKNVLKDKAKNGAKKAGQAVKNKATNAAKDSDLGQSIEAAKEKAQKAKQAAQKAKKAAEQTAKVTKKTTQLIVKIIGAITSSLPVMLIIVGIILVAAILCAFTPGIGGDTSTDELDNYASVDQKTLAKIQALFAKYPNADGALAMATVVYPYYDDLWGNDVSMLVKLPSDEDENTTDEKDEESDDDEDVASEDAVAEDQYLALFQKYHYRKKLKTLLKKLESGGETAFYEYLKTEYFNSNGYDTMISYSTNKDALPDYMIEDLKKIKDEFLNYIGKQKNCYTSLLPGTTAGSSELMKSPVYVNVKKPGCSNASKCTDNYYDTPLTLEEYIKGVAYEEISDTTDINILKAFMVAAKSFTLSRRTTETDGNGNYVANMLWTTADQDFCNIELGCNASNIKANYGYETGGDSDFFHGTNRGPATDEQKALYEEAWEATKNVYVVTKEDATKIAATGYYEGSGCKIGTCMETESLLKDFQGIEYQSTLAHYYTSYAISTVSDSDVNVATVQLGGSETCVVSNNNNAALRAKVIEAAGQALNTIPYYEGGLATTAGIDGNDFGTDVTPDALGNTKKGLGALGFVYWAYWTGANDNLGNINTLENLESQTYEITADQLSEGDIGYSADGTVVGIYMNDGNWIMEDATQKGVVTKPDDRITIYRRANIFKSENYNYNIRTQKPTASEWGSWMQYASTDYIGECPWYARNRALEIITELQSNGTLTETEATTLKNRIIGTSGNGGDFYPGARADNGYKGSTNVQDVKAGSFLGLYSRSEFGHVAVIEYANLDDNNGAGKIIVTDGWASDDSCSSTNFGCINFAYHDFTYSEYITWVSHKDPLGKGEYRFKGYLYFLDQ